MKSTSRFPPGTQATSLSLCHSLCTPEPTMGSCTKPQSWVLPPHLIQHLRWGGSGLPLPWHSISPGDPHRLFMTAPAPTPSPLPITPDICPPGSGQPTPASGEPAYTFHCPLVPEEAGPGMGHLLAFSLVTNPGGPAAGPSCMCDTQAPPACLMCPQGMDTPTGLPEHKSSAQKCPHRTTLVVLHGPRPLPHFQEVFEASLVRH